MEVLKDRVVHWKTDHSNFQMVTFSFQKVMTSNIINLLRAKHLKWDHLVSKANKFKKHRRDNYLSSLMFEMSSNLIKDHQELIFWCKIIRINRLRSTSMPHLWKLFRSTTHDLRWRLENLLRLWTPKYFQMG